jgi:hypothetical protein
MLKMKTPEIEKEIIAVQRRIDDYKNIYRKNKRNKWRSYFFIGVICFFIAILQITKILPDNNEFFLMRQWEILILGSFLMLISSRMIFVHKEVFEFKTTSHLTSKQLKCMLSDLKKEEERWYGQGAKEIAERIVLLLFIIVLSINPILSYFKHGNLSKELLVISFPSLYFISYLIAQFIGSPMTPRKFGKTQSKLQYIIRNIVMDNLSRSGLNPLK